MIGRLRGVIVETPAPDGSCLIEVGGVGYEVHMPVRRGSPFTASSGDVTVFVHTHVREDTLTLFGFESHQDRHAFRQLLTVSGIGPRLAMAVLGGMTGIELAHAVSRTDREKLKGIVGVGAKIIDRILLEMKGKLDHLAMLPAKPMDPSGHGGSAASDSLSQVAAALMQMGYKRAEAAQAVAKVAGGTEDKPVETLLREALLALS
ncbi:MAG: Holliday junction branch migration protein RuvA [Myxococcales bacterium]|nr:Holliday junction branch migration protein RuvA [Myxococcales bacterium]